MEAGLKTQPGALNGEADRNWLSVDDLKKLEGDLKAELETALTSADISADSIIDIRERLSRLPLKITAAQIAELRTRLEEIESELLSCEESGKLIRSVQVARKVELQEQLKQLEPYWERYNVCGVKTSFVNNDIQLLRMERREKKALLFSLSEEIRK